MTYKLIPLFAITLLSAAAMAGGDKPGSTQSSADATFKSLDRNADERLSASEATAHKDLSSQFTALDADSDGFVTKREYAAAFSKTEKQRDY